MYELIVWKRSSLCKFLGLYYQTFTKDIYSFFIIRVCVHELNTVIEPNV